MREGGEDEAMQPLLESKAGQVGSPLRGQPCGSRGKCVVLNPTQVTCFGKVA